MKMKLENVTLLGIDCVDPYRLQAVMDLCQESIEFVQVKILSSIKMEDSRWIEIPHISSMEDFSVFCLKDLVNYILSDYVLLVQWDGFILNPQSWSSRFTDCDYIGSPWVVKDWSINDFDFPSEWRGERVVGNGGFCLRSKFFLETSSRLYNSGLIRRSHPEDIAISVWERDLFIANGVRFATVELARLFAFEGNDDPYSNQFGFHGFYTDIDKWFSQNRGRNKIWNMYLDYKKQKRIPWSPKKQILPDQS